MKVMLEKKFIRKISAANENENVSDFILSMTCISATIRKRENAAWRIMEQRE